MGLTPSPHDRKVSSSQASRHFTERLLFGIESRKFGQGFRGMCTRQILGGSGGKMGERGENSAREALATNRTESKRDLRAQPDFPGFAAKLFSNSDQNLRSSFELKPSLYLLDLILYDFFTYLHIYSIFPSAMRNYDFNLNRGEDSASGRLHRFSLSGRQKGENA